MRALSIIGILFSLGGILTSLVVMTEARCHCYCNDDYYFSSGSVPDEAIVGSLLSMIAFVFFLVFSIVSTAVSFGKKNASRQAVPPFQPQVPPFQHYPPFGQQYPPYPQQPNPYQAPPNPYQPNPYQQQQPPNPFQPPAPDPNSGPKPGDNPPPPPNPWAPK